LLIALGPLYLRITACSIPPEVNTIGDSKRRIKAGKQTGNQPGAAAQISVVLGCALGFMFVRMWGV
jgi:hypothetical protein